MALFWQREVVLPAKRRGCHLVTDEILRALPELKEVAVGIAHIFVKHTSASLTVNENCDPDVRKDMETTLSRLVPDDERLYRHTCEGPDDMPAHVKASLMGAAVTVPRRFNLGTWQGIYLNEHRDHGGSRKLVVTLQGAREAAAGDAAAAAAGAAGRGRRRK